MRRILSVLVVVTLLPAAVGPASARRAEGVRIVDPIVIRSSDGTPIVTTLMLPEDASRRHPVPAVLMTHGWGGRRSRTPDSLTGELLDRGYALLTWDSRGFGQSGGEANVGAPGFEVRDANALIGYLAERKDILQDGPGDPRVGWVGGSNAGGVQLNAAALDRRRRIEAIVPIVPWGNLPHDLLPNGVAKVSWDELLYFFGLVGAAGDGLSSPAGVQSGNYAKEIHVGAHQLHATGQISDDIRAWFARRSTTARAGRIDTPTLIVQGSVDTLFPLEDGFDLYRAIGSDGSPVKLMAFCGGHTLTGCPYPGGDVGDPQAPAGTTPLWARRAADWLDRYVKGVPVSTGPEVEYQANDGFYHGAPSFPLPGTVRVRPAPVSATLVGPGPGGGDGPADANPAPGHELGHSAHRAELLAPADSARAIVGIPRLEVSSTLQGASGHLFFELIDVAPDGTRTTLDDQVMPLEVGAGSSTHVIRMHGVAWVLAPGHALELEITTGSTAYEVSRFGPYAVQVSAAVNLPVTERASVMRRTALR